jgi:hypothetical protein
MTGRVALEGRAIQIPDVLADPEYRATEYQQIFGYRTNLGVPLLRDGSTIGIFSLTRREVKPFTEEQIELVATFADQAVIAIENARLFDEVQARSREVQESLEYQTAISDVLNVISRSPNALNPSSIRSFKRRRAFAKRIIRCFSDYMKASVTSAQATLRTTLSLSPEKIRLFRRGRHAVDALC